MKYLLWPPMAIILVVILLSVGTARYILITLWHFREVTVREAYTIDGNYLFENWSWKGFAKEILVCPWGNERDEE